MREPSILHADLDSFYASVEQRDRPELRGRPVIVGGGVVVAASYEAKARGVRTPMPGREARALCPEAIVVPPRFDAYLQASRAVFDIFHDTSPLVEGISIDEAFLDVTGLWRFNTPAEIAHTLRRRVRDEVGLPITVGVARSKFLAKVASAVGKPDGLLVVAAGAELEFLHPLPVRRLWGVGVKTEQKLRAAGITTVGDLHSCGERALAPIVGVGAARHLYALSLAHDPRRVQTRRRKSIGAQRAQRFSSPGDLDATLIAITERLGKRLRSAGWICGVVVLRLRFGDFTRITRSRALREPTDRTAVVMAVARELLVGAVPLVRQRGCTLLGLSLGNLSDGSSVQLALPFDDDHAAALDVAMDAVRERFGRDAVTRAVLVGRHHGEDAPMLPD